MSKQQLKLWKSDSPEPDLYNYHNDPLHQVDQNIGCCDLEHLIKDLTATIKSWMTNPQLQFDSITNGFKTKWVQLGGSIANYDRALSQAFITSGYYKNFK